MGMWTDLFEVHKLMHNFAVKKGLYDLSQQEEYATLDEL